MPSRRKPLQCDQRAFTLVNSSPENNHLLYQEPQRNRDRWWDQQFFDILFLSATSSRTIAVLLVLDSILRPGLSFVDLEIRGLNTSTTPGTNFVGATYAKKDRTISEE